MVIPLPSTNSETLPVDVEILNDPTSATYPAKSVNLVQWKYLNLDVFKEFNGSNQ